MIPHAALLMFFEVLLKGNAEVRKDKTIKEENKFQIITIFKSSSGFNQDFQRWPVNLCFSLATQQKALIFRKVLKHPEYLIYSCTVLESQATLCIKVKNLRIWISFELYTLLFPVEIFLFVCFRRPWQAAEKVGGVELPLFTAVGTSQLPVGLWHGPDCGYLCFLSLGQCPRTKLQRSLAEWWRKVRIWSRPCPELRLSKPGETDTLHHREQPLPPCAGFSQPQAKVVHPTCPWQPGDMFWASYDTNPLWHSHQQRFAVAV